MFAWFTRRLKNERGFTLVELMVVVVILGILAAIAVPQFMDKTDTARENATMATMKSVQSAINIYYAENSVFPTAAETGADGHIDKVLEDAGIAWPVEDGYGTKLSYGTDTDESEYELQSYGKDENIGGGDDIEATNTTPPTAEKTCDEDLDTYVP